MRALATLFAALFGLAFGSFLNVCLSRWPEGESIVTPRSHCRQCGRTLAWWENIPLVSWLTLRGRCRTCGAWIGLRYPLVEAAVALLWALAVWKAQEDLFPAVVAVGLLVFLWLMVALAVLDAEHLWLPDKLTYPGILLGVVWAFLLGFLLSRALRYPPLDWHDALEAAKWLAGPLIAALLILAIRWLYWLIRRREGLGLGDAKLMALLAAWLGLPGALLAFVLGSILGALAAMVLLAVPALRRGNAAWAQQRLPLGTFLCIGGIVSALWGQPILAAYLRWAGF